MEAVSDNSCSDSSSVADLACTVAGGIQVVVVVVVEAVDRSQPEPEWVVAEDLGSTVALQCC